MGEDSIPVQHLDETVECPICAIIFSVNAIEAHVNECLAGGASVPSATATPGGMSSGEEARENNVQQWSEFNLHRLDNLLQDISSIKQTDLETLESALSGYIAQIKQAKKESM